MRSETIAWVIVGAIVVLFFVGRKNKRTVAAPSGYPNQTPASPAGGDTIAGSGTIAAGTPERWTDANPATPHVYCNHILVGQFPIDKYPVPVLNPPKPIFTPVYPLRPTTTPVTVTRSCRYGGGRVSFYV